MCDNSSRVEFELPMLEVWVRVPVVATVHPKVTIFAILIPLPHRCSTYEPSICIIKTTRRSMRTSSPPHHHVLPHRIRSPRPLLGFQNRLHLDRWLVFPPLPLFHLLLTSTASSRPPMLSNFLLKQKRPLCAPLAHHPNNAFDLSRQHDYYVSRG